jgi:uncharacterized membrane protein
MEWAAINEIFFQVLPFGASFVRLHESATYNSLGFAACRRGCDLNRMKTPPTPSAPMDKTPVDSVPEHIGQNIDRILAFYRREERKISDSQRLLETVGGFMGRPSYLASVLTFVALWLLTNVLFKLLGFQPLDPPPFFWLQGIVSVGALLTTTVVLITQNREAKLEEQRLELELQVNLLTEQKTTKLIHLLEELRRDLPMVKDRHDPEAAALQKPTDLEEVLSALKERSDKD